MTSQSRASLLDLLINITKSFDEGSNPTVVPFLSVIRRNKPTSFVAGVLTPSFCVVLQGSKKIYLGPDLVQYAAGDFVASMIDLPTSGHVATASKNTPFLGLRIDFTTKEIADVIADAKIAVKPRDQKLNSAAFVGKTDNEILEIFVKLLKLLEKPDEAAFVSALLKRELIFRLLKGENGHLFYQKVLFNKKEDGVGRALEWIRKNYASSFTVDRLAKENSMSVSALHQKFKTITTMSPLQYQKQLRLQEARRLMLSGAVDVTTAALQVGYESPSQFNREYRRLFGNPPLKDITSLRKNSPVDPSSQP